MLISTIPLIFISGSSKKESPEKKSDPFAGFAGKLPVLFKSHTPPWGRFIASILQREC